MVTINCDCKLGCIGTSIITSIVVGIITAVLRFNALITVTPAFLWVLLGIAVVYLGINLITSSTCCANNACCCNHLKTVLLGIVGTVIFSIVLLGVTFAATSILGAIITGILLFFFTLTITGTACLVKCRYNCN